MTAKKMSPMVVENANASGGLEIVGHRLIEGVYREQPSDRHVSLRERALEGGDLAPLAMAAKTCRAADFDRNLPSQAREGLEGDGLTLLALDEPLATQEFARLATFLGTPIPETDPATLPFVEDGFVLNLKARYPKTEDVALQPFADNILTLHSEGSGRPVGDQPRYIVLMCCDVGEQGAAASTVVVPMRDVAARLDARTLAVLSGTQYRLDPRPPMIARTVDSRVVFSFRDFSRQPLEWSYSGPDIDAAVVNHAIAALLEAMYSAPMAAVSWVRGLILIIDNQFHFHGRARASGGAVQPRHLKRLRVR